MTKLDSVLKSQDITLLTNVHIVKVMVFPVFMYGCESWTIKKAECWRTDAFELWCWRRPLRVLGLQGDPTSHPKGNQSWIFLGRTVAAAEAPILWPPDVKSQLTGKHCDAGKDESKGGGEGSSRGWDGWIASWTQRTWSEQTPWDSGGQRSYSPWGSKESDTTEQLNWTEDIKSEISAATWMDQELIILNEVSQTEKDKYMIPFICGIDRKKIQINFFITQEEINRHRK